MMAPEHSVSLHGFLLAIPLIESLHEMKEPIGGKTMEEKALSGAVREGYEKCLENIISLANRGAQQPIKSPYVDVSLHDKPVPPEPQPTTQ